MDCLGTYFTHVQTCDVNSCSKCYGMDCLGTYFTHVQTCDVTRVQSATEWAPHCCDHEVLSSMAMEVWKCLVPWLVQDHNKNVPKLDLTKSATNAADTTAKRKTPQKTNPIFRAQKIWTCYNSMQITMFYWRFFSAHCNCADFWEFFQIAMLQNHENFHVFRLFTKDVFFDKLMHLHARKTVRRVYLAADLIGRRLIIPIFSFRLTTLRKESCKLWDCDCTYL